MTTDMFTTLAEAQAYVNKHKYDGVTCPCCSQLYKVWRKKPISTAVAALCRLVSLQQQRDTFYHLDDFNVVTKDRNFNQLINWNLMQPMQSEERTKRSSGFWKATEKGVQFVQDKIQIPKYVFTLDNKVIGYSDQQINIYQALSNKFAYQELFK